MNNFEKTFNRIAYYINYGYNIAAIQFQFQELTPEEFFFCYKAAQQALGD